MKTFNNKYHWVYPVLVIVLFYLGCKPATQKSADSLHPIIKEIEQSAPGDETTLIKIDSLKTLAEIKKDKEALRKAYSFRGLYFYTKKDYPGSQKNYLAALRLSDESKKDSALGNIYDMLGNSFNKLKHRDTAEYFFRKGLEIWDKLGDSIRIGRAYNNIGMAFWDGNIYDSAIIYFEKAMYIREKLNNKEALAFTLNNIGTIYFHWSIYDQALDYYIRSLKIHKELALKDLLPLVLVNIGLVYKETGNPDKAIEYFNEGLKAALISTDSMAVAYSYYAQGLIHQETDPDSAVYFYGKSLELYKAIKQSGGMLICFKGLGEIYIEKKEFDKANKVVSEMLALAEEENLPLRVAESYRYFGLIAKKNREERKAREYFLKSIAISKKLNVETFLRESYLNLSTVEEHLGNKEAALNALKEYVKLKSTVDNEIHKKNLENLKNQLEFEKFRRAQEIQKYENQQQKYFIIGVLVILVIVVVVVLFLIRAFSKSNKLNKKLQQQNKIIHYNAKLLSEKNTELEKINNSKDRLFAIIAHDLRNPFFLLLNLAEILKDEDKSLTEQERDKHIRHLSEVTTKTYYLLENLLNLSASRIGRIIFIPDFINIKAVIEHIYNLYRLQIKNKQITWIIDMSEDLQAFVDKKMIEIVFRNLINNAIKYTKINGRIEVRGIKQNQKVIVTVRDNGIGMSKEVRSTIFTQTFSEPIPGTNNEKGTGLGLSLCNEFVKKNGGEISVESELDKGTTFTITLPTTPKTNF